MGTVVLQASMLVVISSYELDQREQTLPFLGNNNSENSKHTPLR